MKKLALPLVLLLFAGLTCYAQSPMQTVVYLKDGSIYRGNTVLNNDTVIKIKTVESNVIAFRKNKIDSIKKERIPRGHYLPYVIKGRGYFNSTTFGIRNGDSYNGLIFCVQTVNGYRFSRLLAIGAGVGLEPDQILTFYPVYLSVYSDILPGKISPYVHVDGGYNFITSVETPYEFDENNYSDSYTGGWYAGAGVGLKFHTRSLVNIIVGLSYSVEHWKTTTTYYYYTVPNPTIIAYRQSNLTLQVGFGF